MFPASNDMAIASPAAKDKTVVSSAAKAAMDRKELASLKHQKRISPKILSQKR